MAADTVAVAQLAVAADAGFESLSVFHEHFRAGDWLLLSHRSPYAGHGRSYGHGDVYRTDGELVASFVQDNMIRAMPARPAGAGPVL